MLVGGTCLAFSRGMGDQPGVVGVWGLLNACGLAVIGAGNSPCAVRAAAATQCASMHFVVCGVSIGGAGDSLGVVGA